MTFSFAEASLLTIDFWANISDICRAFPTGYAVLTVSRIATLRLMFNIPKRTVTGEHSPEALHTRSSLQPIRSCVFF